MSPSCIVSMASNTTGLSPVNDRGGQCILPNFPARSRDSEPTENFGQKAETEQYA